MADIHAALTLGLRDYAHKSRLQDRARRALGGHRLGRRRRDRGRGVWAGERDRRLAPVRDLLAALARRRPPPRRRTSGIRFETIGIAEVVARCEAALAPVFAGRPRDVTEENIQARVRGVLMMALSNKFGALLLTTGNKSEMAVGYCTLYGDMCGGLAVISDVFKTQVYALANWINADARRAGRPPPIPQSSIDKLPSAELRPNQTDQDSLPPYDMLDAVLKGYVEEGLSRRDLVAQGFSEAVVADVVRKVDLNEYKRKQAAPGLKITPLAFGVGRRIPIVQKYVN